MSFGRRTPPILVALPVVGLLLGGTVGWFMREQAAPTGRDGAVVGQAMPTGAALDALAPVTRVPAAPNTMIIDRATLVGYPDDLGTEVPKGAMVPLTNAGDWQPVDSRTLQPTTPRTAPPSPPLVPTALTEAIPPGTTPSTTPLPVASTTTVPARDPALVDPCVTAVESPCAGAPGVVQSATATETEPDPLVVSMPFAATGASAAMCGAIEGDSVPDPFLDPALRPTIAVITNQPSSIAFTGQWDDGTPIDKLTMVSSPDHEQQWQTAWDTDGTQGSILACLTLPLDDVRTHSSEGRGSLDVSLLAISATGQAQSGGPVTVTTPLDGEDLPFADQLVVGSLGEQRSAAGTLVPTVHLHYALLADQLVPPGTSLDPRTARVFARHELVENADCAGWANNAQGVGRAVSSWVTTTSGQRTVSGRIRPVTVVDADVELDPTLPGGWQGFACLHLFVADADGNRLDLAIRGAEVRSPMTATYEIGAVVADLAFPEGWSIDATWSTPGGALWCGPATWTATGTGATCPVSARSVPDGVVLTLQARDDTGEQRPAFVVTVPINTAYCTPDDPLAAISDGCSTGFTQTVKMPVDATAERSIAVTLTVLRTALAGSMQTTPAHAWQVGGTQAFLG